MSFIYYNFTMYNFINDSYLYYYELYMNVLMHSSAVWNGRCEIIKWTVYECAHAWNDSRALAFRLHVIKYSPIPFCCSIQICSINVLLSLPQFYSMLFREKDNGSEKNNAKVCFLSEWSWTISVILCNKIRRLKL